MTLKNTYILPFLFLVCSAAAQTGNTNLGSESLRLVSTGNYNVAVGDSTLTSLTSASYSTAFGYAAGGNSNVNNGFFLGFSAGYNNTTGNENLFLGSAVGYFSTSGSHNTFIGALSGFNNVAGDNNLFSGEAAGYRNTTGSNNTYIGHATGAGQSGSSFAATNGVITTNPTSSPGTGSNNTAIGAGALQNLTTGHRNTAIGNITGKDINNTTSATTNDVLPANYGSYNTFVGDSTGVDVGRGAYNTMIGQSAGAATEVGSRNTFIGYQAGWDNNRTNRDNAHLNTYLGHRTGLTNRVGSNNVVIGARSDFHSMASGSDRNNYNVVLGYNSQIGLSDNLNAGKDNAIIIGSNSTVDGHYTMAFGHNITARVDSTMVLGGETHRVSVGIGTNTPNIKASLELADTDKGFLVNRLTTAQRNELATNLTADDSGTMVYDNEEKILYTWRGDAWSTSSMDSLEARIQNLENATSAAGVTATASQKFNYQTSLADNLGLPLQNQNVTFKISILQTSAIGDAVYEETHTATTSDSGLTNFQIGGGNVVSGVFADIPWHADEYFLKIEVDTGGGSNYQDFGTQQLLSVPYALHARTADRLSGNVNGNPVSNEAVSTTEIIKGENEMSSLKNEVSALKKLILNLQKQIESKK